MPKPIQRRQFLTSTLAAGAFVATAKLPALADNPALFPKRGRFERLVLAYAHINAGATKPFSILHLSDTHFTDAYAHEDENHQKLKEARTKTFGGRQEEALRDSLAWAKDNVDYVVHTGDLIDWISEANLDLTKKYFGDTVFGCLGNHEYSRYMWLEKSENTEAYKARSSDALKKVFPFDLRLHSKVVNGVNFVTLDNVYGYVCPDQVERFQGEVKKGLPIILCMHVPFHTDGIWRASQKFWSRAGRKFESAAIPEAAGDYKTQRTDPTTRDFIAYLKGEPLLKGILAGHLHITVQERFSPTAIQYVVGGNFMFHGREVTFG